MPLKLHNAVVCALAENAVDRRGLNVAREAADKVQEILNRAYILTSVAAPDNGLELPLYICQLQALAVELAESQYSGIELFYFIPCRLADDAVDGEVEYALEFSDRFARRRVEYPVGGGDARNCGIVSRDAVELALDYPDILRYVAEAQSSAGI